MQIFPTNKAKKRRNALYAAAITALLVFVAMLLLPHGADSAPSGDSFGLDHIALWAGAAGFYAWVVYRLTARWQMLIIWGSLFILFIVFFHSFDLNYVYILSRLPQLIGVGMVTTLYISVASIAIAFVLALLGAVAKLSGNGIAMGIGSFYTSFFRGVPLLMQLFLIYMGLPQINVVIEPIPAGILALSLCYGAYMTEIFRAGIISIPSGQWEAADALGMSRAKIFRHVILPQAMRIIVPPTGNQFIAMLKDSSLVSVVGVWDMMFVARAQGRADFKLMEMLITASLIYWVLSIVLEMVQRWIEKKYAAADKAGTKPPAKIKLTTKLFAMVSNRNE